MRTYAIRILWCKVAIGGSDQGCAALVVPWLRAGKEVDPLVQEKGKCWAEMTGIRMSGSDKPKHLVAPLKTHGRAIEKMWRSYHGAVDFLLDIARTSIVCDTIEQVNFLVEWIAQDQDVVVLRIKNRFDVDYDCGRTAGYRDVAMNLVLVSAQAQGQGLNDTVFEIQIILAELYEKKTEEGHQNYKKFRDLLVA